MKGAAPYAAAAGAIVAAEAIEYLNRPKSGSDIAATREAGTVPGIEAAARQELPCKVKRIDGAKTWYGATIRTLGSGAGEDWLRELHIQRASLCEALGDLGIGKLTLRPKLNAHCARQWLELWLDAWEVAARKSPKAYAAYDISRGTASQHGTCSGSPSSWRELDAKGDSFPASFDDAMHMGLGAPAGGWRCMPTDLGKVLLRVIKLRAAAAYYAQVADIVDAAGEPWILARQAYEALDDLALELDRVSVSYGDAEAEALATLRQDLHPVKFLHKAANWAMVPVEVALNDVIGPALSLFASTVVVGLLPYVVIGGAIYLVVRRRK